ncbi:tRNA epoxyqueuosine(34) reductase QueG [Nguyenibacter sp. L1]|nr:tRNA epoxyqueuosine(34) reductase QueG [Nguyenibacter sp. L1]WRH89253.1 tRNA epoxyqueuosine(34) reductase QueG [Nguyenibacter sp. L1]
MPRPAPCNSALRDAIRDKALALGFDAVGFCDAALGDDARARLADFLAAGHHGAMGWLAERTEQRGDPRALWPEARSVIALGLSYAPGGDPLATTRLPDRGNLSVYARHRDYHDVVKGMLKHLAQFVVAEGARMSAAEGARMIAAEGARRSAAQGAGAGAAPGVKVFVDTAPVMEKPLAERAGLGWQGKHTNLVSRRHGSWLFLGEIYTTLDLPRSAPSGGQCGSCRRCLDACPTDAFPEPYRMDARRCISYLTIENPGPIPLEFRAAMGNRIYGCDDCLAVCPWNRFATESRQMKLRARDDLTAPRLADLARLDDAGFRALFSGSPVKRIGRNRFVRNVLVAVGNSGLAALRPVAQALCDDPDPVVAEAARWAAGRLPT